MGVVTVVWWAVPEVHGGCCHCCVVGSTKGPWWVLSQFCSGRYRRSMVGVITVV